MRGLWVVSVACAVTTAAAAMAAGGAVVPARPLLVVEATWRGDESGPLAISPGGSAARALPGFEVVVSPSGSWVLAENETSVELLRADGTARRRLPWQGPNYVDTAAWSADESLVAYLDSDGVIRVVGHDGRLRRRIDGVGLGFAWSPDGRAIAYVGEGKSGIERAPLEVMRIGSGSVERVADDANWLGSFGVAWSVRGTLAYETTRGGVTIRRTDGRASSIAPPDVYRLEWSADGTVLGVEGLGVVSFFDDRGRKLRDLRTGEWDFSPEGARVAAVLRRGGGDALVLVEPRTGSKRTLLTATRGVSLSGVDFAPNGTRVGVTRDRVPRTVRSVDGGRDVWSVPIAGGHATRLTTPFPDGASYHFVGWGRGGRLPAIPSPRVVRMRPDAAIRTGGVLALTSSGERLAYAVASAGRSCGTLHLTDPQRFADEVVIDGCGEGSSLLDVTPFDGGLLWLVRHDDSGVADEEYRCVFGVDAAGAPLVPLPPLDDRYCEVPRSKPALRELNKSWTEAIASAGPVAVLQSWGAPCRELPDGDCASELVSLSEGRVGRLARTNRSLTLLDANNDHVLALEGDRTIVVLGVDGRVIARFAVGLPRVTGGALDGDHVVVSRTNAIDRYRISTGRRARTIAVVQGLSGPPVLAGASAGVAAYVLGAVVHVVRFVDGRDVALWFDGLAPPVHATLAADRLIVGRQAEGGRPAGVLAAIAVDRLLPQR